MPRPRPNTEIEIKLRVDDLPAIRRSLKRLGASEVSSRTHESNTLYDTPAGELRRRGKLIRVRIERPASNAAKTRGKNPGCATLTYKAPIPSLRHRGKRGAAATARSRFKIKQEAEISLVGADQIGQILHGLNLRPSFRYEKYRTTYCLPGITGLKVELDETPVGTFLELEGPRGAIDRAALRLGYTRSEYMTQTYGALYLADCKRRRQGPSNMLFG
jgi:adenylate cyclase class 2